MVKTVKDCTEDSVACLQGCFDCTDWDMFDQMCTSFNELTDVISSYISLCVESMIPAEHNYHCFPKQQALGNKRSEGGSEQEEEGLFAGYSR